MRTGTPAAAGAEDALDEGRVAVPRPAGAAAFAESFALLLCRFVWSVRCSRSRLSMSSIRRHSMIVAAFSAARRSSELMIEMVRSASSIFSDHATTRASAQTVASSDAIRETCVALKLTFQSYRQGI